MSAPLTPVSRRDQRRRTRRRQRQRRLGWLAFTIVAIVAAPIMLVPGGSKHASGSPSITTAGGASPKSPARRVQIRRRTILVEHAAGSLPAPLQDPSSAVVDGKALLFGGLTAADTSTDQIIELDPTGGRIVGHLPSTRHDTGAAALGRYAYVFGGGDGVSQLDQIVRFDPTTGSASVVGSLPAASSDSGAAAIGGIAYVVGGYTGKRWLNTIVAWRPGRSARVVARLPFAIRYAAVASAGGHLVIAGGSLPDGSVSSAVFEFTPGKPAPVRIGTLPVGTTHATAAAIGNTVYVIGGREAALGSATNRIVSVSIGSGKVAAAGALRSPRSDLAGVALRGRIRVAGGSGAGGTVATVGVLRPTTGAARQVAAVAGTDVYRYDRANMLTAVTRQAKPLVYVPNSQSNTVDVIDPSTYRIVERFSVGYLPQHVVPAWNLRTLYVTNDAGNSLTPIDPKTGKPGPSIPVDDPYNMYFTPDGRHAIVVAERLHHLDFRNPNSFTLQRSLSVPCVGIDHLDFSADGSYLIASCEFSGQLVKVDLSSETVAAVMTLPDGGDGMPQDVKLSADGRVFYVADNRASGVWIVNGDSMHVLGFIHTGAGAHGLYPSRDGKFLYVTNRVAGSISVISFASRKVVATWQIPGGGSPDMGGVTANGRVLWVSGRYNGVVYAISTRTGHLLAKIPVGQGPHGLCVWPQPGRYSLGHTGDMR